MRSVTDMPHALSPETHVSQGFDASLPPQNDMGGSDDIPYCISIDTICFSGQVQVGGKPWQLLVDRCLDDKAPLPEGVERIGAWKPYTHGFGFPGGIQIYANTSARMNPNIYIRCSSKHIQEHYTSGAQYQKLVADCLRILLGGHCPHFSLARVDLAFDFASNLLRYFLNPDFYIRTYKRKFRTHHEDGVLTWVLFGTGESSKIRVYDKLMEVGNVLDKLYWLDVWKARGFKHKGTVHRFEVEMRSDTLRQWDDCEDLAGFESNLNGIIADQLKKFSITIPKGSNSSRFAMVPEFEAISREHSAPFGRVSIPSSKVDDERIKAQTKSAAGLVKGWLVSKAVKGIREIERPSGECKGVHFDLLYAEFCETIPGILDNADLLEELDSRLHAEGFRKRQIGDPRPNTLKWHDNYYLTRVRI